MKAYIMSLLQKLAGEGNSIGDNEIIQWTNNKVLHLIKNLIYCNNSKKEIKNKIKLFI
jgi:hypothetical protein